MLFTAGQAMVSKVISVPLPVRTALGLHDYTQLHCSVLEATSASVTEIIASVAPRAHWRDIWRLETTLCDRMGLVSELADLLKERGVSILATRATTVEAGRAFDLDLHLDATAYASEIDGASEDREENPLVPLTELEAWVAAEFCEDLQFVSPDRPMLRLRRNIPLFRAAGSDVPGHAVRLRSGRVNLAGVLPNTVVARRRSGNTAPSVCHFVADEDHLLLRMYFLPPGLGFRHIRLALRNEVGAFALVASALSEREFNIHQAYLRTTGAADRLLVDLMVRFEYATPQQGDDVRVKEKIRKLVRQRLGKLKAKLSFPAVQEHAAPGGAPLQGSQRHGVKDGRTGKVKKRQTKTRPASRRGKRKEERS